MPLPSRRQVRPPPPPTHPPPISPILSLAPNLDSPESTSSATSRVDPCPSGITPFHATETCENDHGHHVQSMITMQPDVKPSESVLLFGEKPAWGWDYIFVFKLPRSLRPEVLSAKKQSQTNTDEHSPSAEPGKYDKAEDDKPDETMVEMADEEVEKEQEQDDMPNEEPVRREKCELLIQKRIEILSRLKTAGFVFSQVQVPSENVVLVRFSLPETVLKEKAELLEMELRLKGQYGGGYLNFTMGRQEVFVNADEQQDRKCYFSPADRAIIILNVLQGKEYWCCALNIEQMLFKGTVLQAFALHSMQEYPSLVQRAVWEKWWDPTWDPPLLALKNYLGARVSFYFVFVNFYAKRLLIIALVAIPATVLFSALRGSVPLTIVRWVFSLCLVIWTTYFLETWKRHNAQMNVDWGLHDYGEDTMDDSRAQYKGRMRYGFYCEGGFVSLEDLVHRRRGPNAVPERYIEEGNIGHEINNLPQSPYGDPRRQQYAVFVSAMVTLFFVVLVGSITFLLLWYRSDIVNYFEKRTGSAGFAESVPGVANGLLITIFDAIWRFVSYRLTRRENHRTNQMFEDSLIYKRFAFQFVSNYISLFYIAFIRPYLPERRSSVNPMYELESQLRSLVITRSTIGQFLEIGVPFIMSRYKQWRARRNSMQQAYVQTSDGIVTESRLGKGVHASSGDNRYVAESKLGRYDSTMEDYGELVIQFGYLVLFGLAFPLASLVSLLNNLIEVRSDAFKILVLSQRTDADDAADIGAWYYILEFLNVLAVATNVGLLIFTQDSINVLFNLDLRFGGDIWRKVLYRVVAFFIAEHVLLGLKGLTATGMKDVPSTTWRQMARQKFDIARNFDVGWQNAFRGGELLDVDEQQVSLCEKYGDVFEKVSQDGDEEIEKVDPAVPPVLIELEYKDGTGKRG